MFTAGISSDPKRDFSLSSEGSGGGEASPKPQLPGLTLAIDAPIPSVSISSSSSFEARVDAKKDFDLAHFFESLSRATLEERSTIDDAKFEKAATNSITQVIPGLYIGHRPFHTDRLSTPNRSPNRAKDLSSVIFKYGITHVVDCNERSELISTEEVNTAHLPLTSEYSAGENLRQIEELYFAAEYISPRLDSDKVVFIYADQEGSRSGVVATAVLVYRYALKFKEYLATPGSSSSSTQPSSEDLVSCFAGYVQLQRPSFTLLNCWERDTLVALVGRVLNGDLEELKS